MNAKKELMKQLINLYEVIQYVEDDIAEVTIKLFIEEKEKQLLEVMKND